MNTEKSSSKSEILIMHIQTGNLEQGMQAKHNLLLGFIKNWMQKQGQSRETYVLLREKNKMPSKISIRAQVALAARERPCHVKNKARKDR